MFLNQWFQLDVAESLEIASDRATELQEECDKLKRRLAELNARYDAVVDAKSGYERSHDEQDEQALELKRALLDSQIEHADALAAVEAKNMDVNKEEMIMKWGYWRDLWAAIRSIWWETQNYSHSKS